MKKKCNAHYRGQSGKKPLCVKKIIRTKKCNSGCHDQSGKKPLSVKKIIRTKKSNSGVNFSLNVQIYHTFILAASYNLIKREGGNLPTGVASISFRIMMSPVSLTSYPISIEILGT